MPQAALYNDILKLHALYIKHKTISLFFLFRTSKLSSKTGPNSGKGNRSITLPLNRYAYSVTLRVLHPEGVICPT